MSRDLWLKPNVLVTCERTPSQPLESDQAIILIFHQMYPINMYFQVLALRFRRQKEQCKEIEAPIVRHFFRNQ